jgi:hypothetical protein
MKPEACSGLVQILSPRSVRANGLEPNEPGAGLPEGGGGTVGITTAILVRGGDKQPANRAIQPVPLVLRL